VEPIGIKAFNGRELFTYPMKRIRNPIFILAFLATASLSAILFARIAVQSGSNGHVFNNSSQVPICDTGLVLGCSKTLNNGRTNLFFKYRIQKAAELFHSGKVSQLIVSGDNSRSGYNEPAEMKASLVQAGIPENRIYCDYAGFSTLDSILRAKKIFGQNRLIVVSQDFHNRRAVFIGRNHGMEVFGLNANSVDKYNSIKTELREELARVKTVIDVWILDRKPKFLGEKIELSTNRNLRST